MNCHLNYLDVCQTLGSRTPSLHHQWCWCHRSQENEPDKTGLRSWTNEVCTCMDSDLNYLDVCLKLWGLRLTVCDTSGADAKVTRKMNLTGHSTKLNQWCIHNHELRCELSGLYLRLWGLGLLAWVTSGSDDSEAKKIALTGQVKWDDASFFLPHTLPLQHSRWTCLWDRGGMLTDLLSSFSSLRTRGGVFKMLLAADSQGNSSYRHSPNLGKA